MRSIFGASSFAVPHEQSRPQACLSHVMRVTKLAIGIALRLPSSL
jgi:HD superfamily phosphodiesterase